MIYQRSFIFAIYLNRVREDWIKIPKFTEEIVPLQLHRQFVRYFKMSITTSNYVIQWVKKYYNERTRPGGRKEIPLRNKVLMTINFLGTKDTGFQ